MEERLKEIISVYIKTPAGQITHSSAIDRGALGSSIMVHRMYAKLSTEGIVVENYAAIKNFGDLLAKINGKDQGGDPAINGYPEYGTGPRNLSTTRDQGGNALGIDIQEIASLPRVNDFREDAFYTLNFSGTEIAYCIFQPDPYASFAGLFAAKEAIAKADNAYRNRKFNEILIDRLPGGKPVHPDFVISISHGGGVAVAAAIRIGSYSQHTAPINPPVRGIEKWRLRLLVFLIILSLLLAVIAIFIAFNHPIV